MDEITSGQFGGTMEELALIGFARVGAGTWQPTALYEAKRSERIKFSRKNRECDEGRRPRLLANHLPGNYGQRRRHKGIN